MSSTASIDTALDLAKTDRFSHEQILELIITFSLMYRMQDATTKSSN